MRSFANRVMGLLDCNKKKALTSINAPFLYASPIVSAPFILNVIKSLTPGMGAIVMAEMS